MVKKTGLPVITFILITGLYNCQNTNPGQDSSAWLKTDEIVRQINLPEIPSRTFNLVDFGGSGDGVSDNKTVFDSIVMFCHSQGGGTINVDSGTYLINGPIHLKSNMNLHLNDGAKLVFGSDPENYLPVVLTSWEGTRLYNYSPFIYVFKASNVSITGNGEIDGESSETWNSWKSLQDDDKNLSRRMNNQDTPLEERVFGEGHYLRPHLIQFYDCENILVEGIRISDAPFWCLHFVFSRDITVRDLEYDAYNLNNDGIDPESSENVLIENITFGNNDDNIAIKAGRDREGRTLGRSSRNIVVRNCRFRGHNAIAVGSEMSGGVHDVFVEDCSYAGKVIYGFYLKGNRDRGGEVSNIYARNLEFDTTRATIIIDSDYKNEGSCCPPLFKNVFVDNVRAKHADDYGIFLNGPPDRPLDSLFISNVEIVSTANPIIIQNADHLNFKNVKINGKDYSDIKNEN